MEGKKEACAIKDCQSHWITKQLLRLKGNKDAGLYILKQGIMRSIWNTVRNQVKSLTRKVTRQYRNRILPPKLKLIQRNFGAMFNERPKHM